MENQSFCDNEGASPRQIFGGSVFSTAFAVIYLGSRCFNEYWYVYKCQVQVDDEQLMFTMGYIFTWALRRKGMIRLY